MVRVAGGVRITSGKALNKGGGGKAGTNTAGSSSSTPSKSSKSSSSRLPPITQQETPKWQKPITTFFPTTNQPPTSKSEIQENDHKHEVCGLESEDLEKATLPKTEHACDQLQEQK